MPDNVLPFAAGQPLPRWRLNVSVGVEILVSSRRKPGPRPDSEVRDAVIKDIRAALDPAITGPMRELDLSDRPGRPGGSGPRYMASPAGIFRKILESYVPNWREPMSAESVMAEALRSLDAVLSKPISPP